MLRFPSVRCPFVLTVFLCGLFLLHAHAQSTDDVHIAPRVAPKKTEPEPGDLRVHQKPIRLDVSLVLVPVMVTDQHGSPVMNLNRNDFKLFEGEKEQHVSYFYSEDAPISVGLIVDLSGSMGNKLDRVREAVDEFFKVADPHDDYFVITFSDKPTLFANTTQSTETIESRLGEMKAHGNTALADAVHDGLMKLKSAYYRRKALVIISDGGDNASRHSLRSVKNLAKEADAEIYAIDVCDAPAVLLTKKLEEKFGKQWLTQLTGVTGGRTIAVDNASKIPGAAAQISRELRNQYVLAFRPENNPHKGKWRKLKVKIVRPMTDLAYQLYYRTGYMARTDEDQGQ
jgi:Ca-activated chloride channel family protein